MELWNWKAITVINAHERRNNVYIECMKAGLRLIASGDFNMKDMITHEFSLGEVDKAFSMMIDKPKGFIKSVIRI
jgi:threonine dehydrogenase-like Zn-dependent dehydrogenase